MLKGYNNSHIQSKFCANNNGQYFFIQKWVELTSNYSLLTYQIRFKNARNLLVEIIDVIELLENSDMNTSNLTCVIEEAKVALEKDLCLKEHQTQMYYALITGLGKFNLKENENAKKGNSASLVRLKAQINVFLKTVNQDKYCKWLIDDLKESIDNCCCDRIHLYSELLASELINKEWTSSGLYSLFMQTFSVQNNEIFDNSWRKFKNKLLDGKEKFVFFFKCNYANSKEIGFLPTGISIVLGSEICTEFLKAKNHVSEEHAYIRFECMHYDYKYSHQSAYYKIKQLNAIYSFYEEDFKVISDDKCIIGFENGNVLPLEGIIKSEKQMDFSKLNSEVDNLKHMLTSETLNKISIKRLTDALMQYSNSLESTTPDKKFISLWSCIETLLNTGQYSSVIEHIKQIVPAVMCSRYAYKILRNLLNDIGRCNFTVEYNGRIINTLEADYTDINSILEMLKDNTQFAYLLSRCDDNELLKYRLEKLKDSFSTNEKLYKFISNNFNNVCWNIQRLYRYRNQIVHYSDVLGNVTILCSHLNYYIRTIVSEINYRFFQNDGTEFNSLVEIYSYLFDNYFALINFLEPQKGHVKNSMPYLNEFILKSAIEQ